MVTVNCARIIYGNQVATNGVVHVIDRVITSVGSTIQDYIEVEEDLTKLAVSVHIIHIFYIFFMLKFLNHNAISETTC